MINHYKNTAIALLGFLCLLSCSKETIVAPATSSAISELKEWTHQVDPLGRASSIVWEVAIPIKLSDSVTAFSAPVKNTSGESGPDFMEFITFELGGKRHGWYKSYRRLNETDMEIIIQSIEGKTLKAGFLRKKKALSPKGKSVSMREMNLSQLEIDLIYGYLMGVLLNNVNVYGTSQYGGGGYVDYSYSRPNSMDYYGNYEGGGSGGGSGRSGSESDQTNVNFNDFNYTELESKLTNPCFKEVIAELKKNNVYGKISEIIQKFDFSKQGLKYSVIFNENTADADTNLNEKNAYVLGNVITLNSVDLKNASKEYIARVIIHEILHVYIDNRLASTDHQEMLNDYVDEIANFLNKLYQTDKKEAKILSLLGLQKEKGCYPFLLKDLGISAWDVYNTDQKYKNQNYGKHCN
jgi:hypothetical protein